MPIPERAAKCPTFVNLRKRSQPLSAEKVAAPCIEGFRFRWLVFSTPRNGLTLCALVRPFGGGVLVDYGTRLQTNGSANQRRPLRKVVIKSTREKSFQCGLIKGTQDYHGGSSQVSSVKGPRQTERNAVFDARFKALPVPPAGVGSCSSASRGGGPSRRECLGEIPRGVLHGWAMGREGEVTEIPQTTKTNLAALSALDSRISIDHTGL